MAEEERFEKRPVRIDEADDTNAPYMARMLPGSTTLASFFMPRCKNGSPTANPEELCKDNAPAIDSTIVMAFQYGAITQYKFTVDGEGSTSTAPMVTCALLSFVPLIPPPLSSPPPLCPLLLPSPLFSSLSVFPCSHCGQDCRACSDWTGSRGSVCAGAVSSLGLDGMGC